MKLAVLVKEVPEASARTRIDPSTLRLDRSGPAALNPFDAHALEEALRLKERTGDGEVVAIMMAPARGAESLRKALAIGADRAVHVSDDSLAGSDLAPDVHGTLDDSHVANKGDLLILIDAAAGDVSIRSIASYLDRLRDSRPSDPASPVAVPGDGARQRRAATERSGIELPQPLLEHLLALEAA